MHSCQRAFQQQRLSGLTASSPPLSLWLRCHCDWRMHARHRVQTVNLPLVSVLCAMRCSLLLQWWRVLQP